MRNLGCALELPRGSQKYTRNTESTVDGLGHSKFNTCFSGQTEPKLGRGGGTFKYLFNQ